MTKPLEAYTETAFALLGGRLPEVVYLPPSLRTRHTSAPEPSEAQDQIDRIVKADPLGYLFAIMEGKSVASFTIKPVAELRSQSKPKRGRPAKDTATGRMKLAEEGGQAIYIEFHSPTPADRERVAMFLAKLIHRNGHTADETREDNDFARLCARRAAEVRAENVQTAEDGSSMHAAA
jgi:hypothetical protein